MNKKKKRAGSSGQPQAAPKSHSHSADSPATLKELLGADTVAKLKSHAEALKAEEIRQAAQKKQQAEEAKQAERKRLENNFEYLLANSSEDWRKFK